MPYIKVEGIKEIRQLSKNLDRYPKVLDLMSREIGEEAAMAGQLRAKNTLAAKRGRIGTSATGALEGSIRMHPIKTKSTSRASMYEFRISAGRGISARFMSPGNKDPGVGYAYYQEEGYRPHWIFTPWLWHRSAISWDEGKQELGRESPWTHVPGEPGKKFMEAGFKAAGDKAARLLAKRSAELGRDLLYASGRRYK